MLFRNNTGALEDATGRLVRYGLCDGSSDLIGILRPSGTFVAIEVKASGAKTNKRRKEMQDAFLALVRSFGGISGYASSVEEALELIEGEILRRRTGT